MTTFKFNQPFTENLYLSLDGRNAKLCITAIKRQSGISRQWQVYALKQPFNVKLTGRGPGS
jgi:hypothetical protein